MIIIKFEKIKNLDHEVKEKASIIDMCGLIDNKASFKLI